MEIKQKKSNFISKYLILAVFFFGFTITSYAVFKYFSLKNSYNSFKENFATDNFDFLANEEKENLDKIFNVSYSMDNSCVDLNYVSMLSLLTKSDKNDFYKITVLASPDFTKENRKTIKKIRNKFKNCSIKIVNMKEKYKELGSSTPFYKFDIPKILPNEKLCLHLSPDTFIRRDISDLFFFEELDKNCVCGIRNINDLIKRDSKYHEEVLGIPNLDTYICSNILLMNLEKMREENNISKFEEQIKNFKHDSSKFVFLDQDILNIAYFGSIKTLPCTYGLLMSSDPFKSFQENEYAQWTSNSELWESGRKDPHVVIFSDPKQEPINDFSIQWWKLIKETEYFKPIYEKYGANLNEENKNKLNML